MIAREPTDRQPGLGRRNMLRGAAALALLSGCTRQSAGAQPAAGPAAVLAQQTRDAAAVEAAKGRSAALLAGAQLAAVAASSSSGVAMLTRIAADHRAHLAALGAVGASTVAGGTAATSSGADQAGAELDGAREALADVTGTSGGFGVSAPVAVLLARIAAGRAAHADLLGADVADPLPAADPTPGPSPSGLDDSAAAQTARQALTRLVEDLHAAVYGYGMVAARVGEADVAQADDDWSRHRSRRDAYIAALLGLGGRVPAALSAYQVGDVADTAAAAALAVRIETALTARLLATLAQVESPMRGMLAGDVVASVLRTQRWGGTVPELPGSP